MTTFYCFPTDQGFKPEWIKDGVAISTIGNHYEPLPDPLPEPELDENGAPIPFEPVFIGYLVNAISPVDEWSEFEVTPTQPMRIFG